MKVGDALSIRSIHATLEAEHHAGQEPKFTYTLSLAGISNGGTDALTISGKGTGAEIVKQFNEQVAANKKAFAALGTYDVFISEPRAFHDEQFDKTVFEAPAINLGAGLAARKGTAGDYQAVRFALTRYTGAHEVIGEPLPASPSRHLTSVKRLRLAAVEEADEARWRELVRLGDGCLRRVRCWSQKVRAPGLVVRAPKPRGIRHRRATSREVVYEFTTSTSIC